VRGVAVPPAGGFRERRAAACHDHLGQPFLVDRPLDQRRASSGSGSFGEVVVAVDAVARDRHEQASRQDAAGILADRRDLEFGQSRSPDGTAAFARPLQQSGMLQAGDQALQRLRLRGLSRGQ